MKFKIEFILWIVFIGLIILKYLNLGINGIGLGIIVSGGILAQMHMIFANIVLNDAVFIKEKKKFDVSTIDKTQHILGTVYGYVAAVSILYILFRVMYWPGTSIMGIVGIVGLPIVIFATLFLVKDKENSFLKGLTKRGFFLGFLVILLYRTSNYTLVDIQYRNYPEYRDAKKALMRNPDDKQVQAEFERIRSEM
jgi:hypothetical protein